MSHILMICSDFTSPSDANGICVNNIVKELVNRGHKVSVVSESEKNGIIFKNESLNVYGAARPWFTRFCNKYQNCDGAKKVLFDCIRAIRGIYASALFPNVSPIRSKKVENLSNKIIHDGTIDIVIGVYRPFDSLQVLKRLKKKYGTKIITCAYHLDSILTPNSDSRWIRTFKEKRALHELRQEYEIIDHFLLPESARKIYPQSSKIDYVDFPLYIDNPDIIPCDFQYNKDDWNIVYIGTIDGKNREIHTIKCLLDRINSNSKKRIVLHIWGKITDEKTMTQINVSQFIQYHGLIENVYTAYLLKTADFCLNLSNAITYNMVPSKIFQLFALSKPIINIVANDNDVSLEYFIKNEYVINIYKKFNTDCNAALLTKWMRDPLLERPVNISRLYGKSRPTYTVELIESYL